MAVHCEKEAPDRASSEPHREDESDDDDQSQRQ
jgi:hypothetical protein